MNKNKNKNFNLFYIFLPLIFGYLTTFICGFKNNDNDNDNVIIPDIVFKIIWPILYILIGIVLFNLANESNGNFNLLFWLIIVLNILLCSWIIMNNCLNNYIISLIILILSILLTLFIIILLGNNVNRYLTIPLLLWLIVAFIVYIN